MEAVFEKIVVIVQTADCLYGYILWFVLSGYCGEKDS